MNLAKYKPGECEIGTDMKLYTATAFADLHNIIPEVLHTYNEVKEILTRERGMYFHAGKYSPC